VVCQKKKKISKPKLWFHKPFDRMGGLSRGFQSRIGSARKLSGNAYGIIIIFLTDKNPTTLIVLIAVINAITVPANGNAIYCLNLLISSIYSTGFIFIADVLNVKLLTNGPTLKCSVNFFHLNTNHVVSIIIVINANVKYTINAVNAIDAVYVIVAIDLINAIHLNKSTYVIKHTKLESIARLIPANPITLLIIICCLIYASHVFPLIDATDVTNSRWICSLTIRIHETTLKFLN